MVRPEKIDFKYNLKIYFSFLKQHKLKIILALLFALIMEIVSVVEKYLFKVIVDDGTSFATGTLIRSEFIHILIIVAIVFVLVVVLRSISKYFVNFIITRLTTSMMTDLKRKFFNHIIKLSHSFHITHKTGSMITRLIRGGWAVDHLNDVFIFNVIPIVFQTIFVISALVYFDLTSAIVILVVSLIFILYSISLQQLQQKSNLYANETEDVEKGNITDFFTNIDSIKYFGQEERIKKKFRFLTDNSRWAWIKNWDYYNWFGSGQKFILGIGTFFLVYFPLKKFLNGMLSIGDLVFIYTIFGHLSSQLFGFVHGIRNFFKSMADMESLFYYGKIKNDIEEKPNAKELDVKIGMIEFKDVTFSYPRRKLFEDFNLKINQNEKVALVGHSGCGKTTLVKLLYRLFDIQQGEILIDGKNIKDIKQESLRSELSIVPQECVLFDDTIYNNIAFSNPKATRKDILKAIKFAQLDKVIKDFPQKEKTVVGERGVKLSGGERQRVSIARAILANKKILVLDEATSSLDSQTEHEIQKGLEKLMKGRTNIIIAHRLSTIMQADKIVVLSKGQIMQMGPHNELIKESGHYRNLWNMQKGGYIK